MVFTIQTFKLDQWILDYYKELDLHVTKLRRYPMYFGLDHFQCVLEGVRYISRKINTEKVAALKEEYGKSILVLSAMLDEVRLDGFDGTIFCTEGVHVRSSTNIVTLLVEKLDTQNYIATSEFVIAKAGWEIIS